MKNKNEIAVLGKKISTSIQDLDIFKLKFWSENPRVNSIIKRQFGNEAISDEDIESVLREEEHVKELLQDIKKHGGLIDEILVKGSIVLEGNSRLCAYRMLYAKAEEKEDEDEMLKWSYIKAKVIPDTTTEEEIFTILGTWHIKGKKQWDTFEKAAYLKKMTGMHNSNVEKIGEIIGESKTFVENTIEAHDLMVKHEVFDLRKYSYFIEMVKNKAINEEQEKDKQTREKIILAIKNNQFNKAEEIRDVYKVLKDKVAKRSFFDEHLNFAEALEIAIDRHPEFDGVLFSTLKKTGIKLSKIEAKEIERIKCDIQGDSNKKYIIKNFYKEVKKFCKNIGVVE